MTTDSETTEQYLTVVQNRFLISVLVFCVTWLQTWNSVQFANAFAIAITFARWRRRSEEATTVTYGANFICWYLQFADAVHLRVLFEVHQGIRHSSAASRESKAAFNCCYCCFLLLYSCNNNNHNSICSYITLHKKLFRVAYSWKTSKPLNGAQMNHSWAVNERENRNVLRRFRKTARVEVTSRGRLFQTRLPATGKARKSTNNGEDDERRQRRLDSATRWMWLERYLGARPFRHRKTSTANL